MHRTPAYRLTNLCVTLLFACPLLSAVAAAETSTVRADRIIKARVTVIIDKLPADKRLKMAKFDRQVQAYIESYRYIEENFVAPFEVGLQLFLEDYPYNGEDRYRCSILLNGPDVQYSDKRARFAFQENEQLPRSQGFSAIGALIDFYLYLVIGNELDKYEELEGTPYFEKARLIVEQAKFGQFFEGWDRREELIRSIVTENYRKFREMKNYYFYGVWGVQDDPPKARGYVKQAIRQLAAVLAENRDNLAAQQFIDAHYLEIIDLFKDSGDSEVFNILKNLNPERADIYNLYIQ